MARIKKGDLVKIIEGDNKGTTAKVEKVLPKKSAVLLENIGKRTRKIKPSRYNPQGGTKELHIPVDLSKVALVIDEKSLKTSRVGYKVDENGKKIRLARQDKNKEIK